MSNGKKWVEVPDNTYGYRAPGWTNRILNMPDENVSDYESFHVYIIDDVDREHGVQGQGSAGKVQHEYLCNQMNDLFNNVFTDCTVHNVRMQPRDREEDFVQYFAGELERYNAHDLVAIYFHGKTGEKDKEYTWHFRGPGPKQINAYDFIRQVNDSQADCYFILDCFIPTNFPLEWKRDKTMTEFSVTGHQMRNMQGRPINDQGNFTETFCRSIRDLVNSPRKGRARQTIHEIMGKDGRICSRPLRVWTARPDKTKRNRVWRIFVDVERLNETGRLTLRKCEVTGRRAGDGEFERDLNDVRVDEEIGHSRARRKRKFGGRRDKDDGSDSDSDSANDSALGEDEDGNNNRANAYRADPHSDSENDMDDLVRPLLHSRPSIRPHSPPANSPRKKTTIKRSDSPFFDLQGVWRRGSESSVKKEPSSSQGVEFVSSTGVTNYIDLTTSEGEGEVVDLTREDDDDGLFVLQY